MSHTHKVGDLCVFVNDFGTCFGVRVIVKNPEPDRWDIRPTDTPWYPAHTHNLLPLYDEDLRVFLSLTRDSLPHFEEKYGRPATLEERRALLDTDPFDGEE